jgi:hypothetical protein
MHEERGIALEQSMNKKLPGILKRRDFIATAAGVTALAPALALTEAAHSPGSAAAPDTAAAPSTSAPGISERSDPNLAATGATGSAFGGTLTMLTLVRSAQALQRRRDDDVV